MYEAKHTHVRTVSDERVLSGCVFATVWMVFIFGTEKIVTFILI